MVPTGNLVDLSEKLGILEKLKRKLMKYPDVATVVWLRGNINKLQDLRESFYQNDKCSVNFNSNTITTSMRTNMFTAATQACCGAPPRQTTL
jgi:hypothetical protein